MCASFFFILLFLLPLLPPITVLTDLHGTRDAPLMLSGLAVLTVAHCTAPLRTLRTLRTQNL
jgi:hypothetical protein